MVNSGISLKNRTVNIADAKAHLSELAERAASGETVVLSRRGKPIARLASLEHPRRPVELSKLRELTDAMPEQPEQGGTLVRRMRDGERY